jgi:hypothetical protein
MIAMHMFWSRYQWNAQATIVRLSKSLRARGYVVWLDIDCMKGSTMDAMAQAVDDAECVLYAVSLAYKVRGGHNVVAAHGRVSEELRQPRVCAAGICKLPFRARIRPPAGR